MTTVRRGQPAQVVVWVAVMVPLVFLPIVGLMIDAGTMFSAKRELQTLADGAARVGAMQIDRPALHNVTRNPRAKVTLAEGEARDKAREYLERMGFQAPTDDPTQITFRDEYIQVVVARQVRPGFLRLVHVGPVTIHATGRAQPCAAVVGNDCT